MPKLNLSVLNWYWVWVERYMDDNDIGLAELFREAITPKLCAEYPEFREIIRAEKKKQSALDQA